MAHTPGPWREYVSSQNRWIGNADTGEIVCDKPQVNYNDDRMDVRWEKNAPLIAAAPDMLEALKDLVKVIEKWPNLHPHGDYLHGYPLMQSRKVIAKAEGVKP